MILLEKSKIIIFCDSNLVQIFSFIYFYTYCKKYYYLLKTKIELLFKITE